MGIFWRREAVSATDSRVWKSVPSVGPGPTAARTRVNSAIEFAIEIRGSKRSGSETLRGPCWFLWAPAGADW